MAKDTYCIAIFHIVGVKNGEIKRATFSAEGARIISIDDKHIVISSKIFAIKSELIENVVILFVCGNNSRIIFSATPVCNVKEKGEMIYTLNIPQKRSVILPNGKLFEYECAPIVKYQEIKKGKNPLGRNSWGEKDEVVF